MFGRPHLGHGYAVGGPDRTEPHRQARGSFGSQAHRPQGFGAEVMPRHSQKNQGTLDLNDPRLYGVDVDPKVLEEVYGEKKNSSQQQPRRTEVQKPSSGFDHGFEKFATFNKE